MNYQFISYKIMALELIRQTGLPIATEAEAILAEKNNATTMHSIEPFPVYLQNQTQTGYNYFNYNLGIVPKPAMYNTTINVEIPYGTTIAELKIFDAYNNQGLLQTHSLTEGTNSTSINVSNLISGLYIVAIVVDGNVVANANLIVIH